jgi:glycosyltransferase involved in cell wall biosynthesis
MDRNLEGVAAVPSSSRLRVHAVLWNVVSSGSVAYALTELIENLPDREVDRKLWYLTRGTEPFRDYQRPTLPKSLFRALCKARVPMALQGAIGRRIALRQIRAGDIVYVWPPFDRQLILRARRRGAIVVAERTNCMGQVVREVLVRAFRRRGLPLPPGWCDPGEIAEETSLMLQCDFVTAPNALVAQSLRDIGVPQNRILETQYGFDPARLSGAIGISRPPRPPVFAFVGLGIVRKGLDVLLEAWERAGVDGKLIIAGQVEPDLKAAYAKIFARNDVEELGFVKDISTVYATADVFIFPTHEEGGPQVIYEAAACGLPSIVSPMGAGRIVRDEAEALFVDPADVDDVAGAISTLALDEQLRRRLGEAAVERAKDFTWARAGEHLLSEFRRAAAVGARASHGNSAQ